MSINNESIDGKNPTNESEKSQKNMESVATNDTSPESKHDDGIDRNKYREKFIPINKSDLINLILEDGKLTESQKEDFKEFCEILESIYHREFYLKQKEIKECYYPLNPDLDVVKLRSDFTEEQIDSNAEAFSKHLKGVLTDANYERVSDEELDKALETSSLYKVSLIVDFDDFKEYALYKRGEATKEVEIKKLFGLIKKKIKVDMYERVLIYLRFKNEDYFVDKALGKYQLASKSKVINFLTKVERLFKTKKRKKILERLAVEPNSTTLKLFKDVPKADIEMLFPNTRIFMTLKDVLIIGIPAIVGFVSSLVSRVFVALSLIIGVFIILSSSTDWTSDQLIELLKKAVKGFAAIGAFAAYILRQWNKYKNKKINFMKELSENLYFKNLDNNIGVFSNIIDSAEEQEFKESVLGYYFLLIEPKPITYKELDKMAEDWILKKIGVDVDFEVEDSLRKLNNLELTIKDENDGYTVVSLKESLRKMDYLWDNYFKYNE